MKKTLKNLFLAFMICFIATSISADCVRGTGGACSNGTITEQAEDGTLSGCNSSTFYAGYNGTGYVASFNATGDSITITFDADCDETMDLTIRYMCGSGSKIADIELNSTLEEDDYAFSCSGIGDNQWITDTIENLDVIDGENELVLTRAASDYHLHIDEIVFD